MTFQRQVALPTTIQVLPPGSQMTLADFQQSSDLIGELMAEEGHPRNTPKVDRIDPRFLKIGATGGNVFLRDQENTIVGCGTLGGFPISGVQVLQNSYIRPSYRGNGLASKIMDARIDIAQKSGCQILITGTKNPIVKSMVTKRGFVPIGFEPKRGYQWYALNMQGPGSALPGADKEKIGTILHLESQPNQ
ncbi:MAG: GNAT family N-acetyltransferase [Cyanobacteria bacterium]|nr:GNAT family N-acetyltransferase [Cyanobacteriota bacterium]